MRPKLLLLTLLACLFVMNSPAAILTFRADLDGPSENPPVPSPGTGLATVIYDDVLHTLRVIADFENLVGTTTVAHIHCCVLPPGNVGVATTTPTFPGFPAGVTMGSYDMTFDLTMASSFNGTFITNNGGTPAGAEAALAAGMSAGMAYFNIHTDFRPGGEIRGFLAVIPEPGTFVLLGAALAGLAIVRRKR